MTKLTKSQVKTFEKTYVEKGTTFKIVATVRHDDNCGNGHNTFSIVGDIQRKARNGRWVDDRCGQIREDIVKRFPNLAPYLKWHLCSTDGPLHYIANTLYHVKNGNLDYARSTAIWPEATDEELTSDNLRERLEQRLPTLMESFRAAVESLGFEY